MNLIGIALAAIGGRAVIPNPNQLLADLVAALNATHWSSWQSTDRFMPQLEAAEDYASRLKGIGHATTD